MQIIDYRTHPQSPRSWGGNAPFYPLTPYPSERIKEFAIDILCALQLKEAETVHSKIFTNKLIQLPSALQESDFAVFLRSQKPSSELQACKMYFYTCRVFGHHINAYSNIVGGVHTFFGLEELAYATVPEIRELIIRKDEMYHSLTNDLPTVTGRIKCDKPLLKLNTVTKEYHVQLVKIEKSIIVLFNGYRIASLQVNFAKKNHRIISVSARILKWFEAPLSDMYWTHQCLSQKLQTFFFESL